MKQLSDEIAQYLSNILADKLTVGDELQDFIVENTMSSALITVSSTYSVVRGRLEVKTGLLWEDRITSRATHIESVHKVVDDHIVVSPDYYNVDVLTSGLDVNFTLTGDHSTSSDVFLKCSEMEDIAGALCIAKAMQIYELFEAELQRKFKEWSKEEEVNISIPASKVKVGDEIQTSEGYIEVGGVQVMQGGARIGLFTRKGLMGIDAAAVVTVRRSEEV